MRNLAPLTLLAAVLMTGCNSKDTDEISSEAKSAASSAGKTISGVTLKGKVETALNLRKDVDISMMKIEAKDGVVTLTGAVKSDAEKKTVHDIVGNTTGVDKVVDTDLKIAK